MVEYTGWFTDGRSFDSNVGKKAHEFTLGSSNQVIKAWQEGIATMKVGGRRKLIVPPDLAYGKKGYYNLIPPNSTLVFEIQLLEIR